RPIASWTVAAPSPASWSTMARSARVIPVTMTLRISSALLAAVEQRRDHAAQVAAGGFLGLGGTAAGDRVDDRQVLGQRLLWPPRPQRQLELMPDQLPVQPLEQGG